MEAAALDTDPGIRVPLLLIKPKDASGPLAVVLALAQGGKEAFLSERAAGLAAVLQRNIAICLADVRGTGETARTATRGPASASLAATELMLGRTALGVRLKDARSVLRYLRGRDDLDAAAWLYGETHLRKLIRMACCSIRIRASSADRKPSTRPILLVACWHCSWQCTMNRFVQWLCRGD